MKSARQRYHELTSGRTAFLDIALECSKLTIPTLLMHEETTTDHTRFKTPWQSVGAKGVVTLASKLMLGLLPPSTSFFKISCSLALITPDSDTLIVKGPFFTVKVSISFGTVS